MDADDVLDAQYRSGFLQLKAALPPQTDVVMLPYHTAFDQAGAPTFTYYRERLIRRLAGAAVERALSTRPSRRWATWVYWDKAAISHRKPGPGDPDRNLGIYQGLLAQGGKPSLPGSGSTTPGSWLPTAGGGSRCPVGGVPGLRGGLVENHGEACRDLSACYPAPGQGGGGLPRPGKSPAPGAAPGGALLRFRRLFPGAGGTIPPRPSGMRRPSPGPGRTARGPLSPQTATATCPASSCACATTAWGTWSALGSTTAGRASISPRPGVPLQPAVFSRGWGRPFHKLPLWVRRTLPYGRGKSFFHPGALRPCFLPVNALL